jgi:drug/metabolite transporter (DMT)-like permease
LIVFETLAALAYAQWHRAEWPPLMGVAGVALLVGGVSWALRLKPVPPPGRERHLPASSP